MSSDYASFGSLLPPAGGAVDPFSSTVAELPRPPDDSPQQAALVAQTAEAPPSGLRVVAVGIGALALVGGAVVAALCVQTIAKAVTISAAYAVSHPFMTGVIVGALGGACAVRYYSAAPLAVPPASDGEESDAEGPAAPEGVLPKDRQAAQAFVEEESPSDSEEEESEGMRSLLERRGRPSLSEAPKAPTRRDVLARLAPGQPAASLCERVPLFSDFLNINAVSHLGSLTQSLLELLKERSDLQYTQKRLSTEISKQTEEREKLAADHEVEERKHLEMIQALRTSALGQSVNGMALLRK